MAFTMTGFLIGRDRSVSWHEGVLAGDPDVIDLLILAAERFDGRRVGPPEGPVTRTKEDHLRSGISIQFLAAEVFDLGYTAGGDVPHRGHHPDVL